MKYKQLYLQEKHRREFYENIRPELVVLWDQNQRIKIEFFKELEKTIMFGDSLSTPKRFTGLSVVSTKDVKK